MQNMDAPIAYYLITNNKTEKPVRHISLNPDPEDKVNDKDYREMAQQYMQEMGCLVL